MKCPKCGEMLIARGGTVKASIKQGYYECSVCKREYVLKDEEILVLMKK